MYVEPVLPPRRGETDSTRHVVVLEEDYLEYAIVDANAVFVDRLIEAIVPRSYDEIVREALLSCEISAYLGQVSNGGFSQLLYNTRWDAEMFTRIREGLVAIGAKQHLVIFDEASRLVEREGPQGIETLLETGAVELYRYFESLGNKFHELNRTEEECLLELNTNWLTTLPNLQVRSKDEIDAEIERRRHAIPDAEQRRKDAELGPKYRRQIQNLAAKAGHKFLKETVYTRTPHSGARNPLAWNFVTDRGKFYMLEESGKAAMYGRADHFKVAEIDI